MFGERRVSLIFPAYNEEASIFRAVTEFAAVGVFDEIVVVNNRSSDNTETEALRAGARVVREDIPGYGAALTRGLREATGDLLVLSEPDGTFVGHDVVKLLAYSGEFDMVCGTRTTPLMIWHGANMGYAIRLGNTLLAKVLELVYSGPSLSDCGCTFRLISRDGWSKLQPHITVRGSHFLPEMVILALKLRLRVIEIPLNYRDRIGTSKITGNWRGLVRTALNMAWLIVRYIPFRPHR
jgi:glycosyltransferase involved in cell wall biosynthesis